MSYEKRILSICIAASLLVSASFYGERNVQAENSNTVQQAIQSKNGWLKEESSWYYLNPHCYYMYTGWDIIDGQFHYFAQNGAWQYSE